MPDIDLILEGEALNEYISNDGTLLLIGLHDGRWKIVDLQTKRSLAEFHDLNDCITDMQYSPNGCILAVVTKGGVIHLYQVTNDGKKYNRIGRCMVSIQCF